MYDEAVHLRVTGGWIIHLLGVPWNELPLPSRTHTCTPATTARFGAVVIEQYRRCACGGWSRLSMGWPDWGPWTDVNSRRHGDAHSLTLF